MDAVAFEVFRDESAVLALLAPLSFGMLLPLALAGAALGWERRGTRLLVLALLLLALSIVAFFVVGRFRLGLVPLLCPLAGVALAGWRTLLRSPAALALFAAGALAAWWPLPSPGDPRALSASNLASELLRRGEPERAEEWARRAYAADPTSAEAAFNLGTALRRLGRDQEAAEPFRAALELEPAYAAECLAELGAIAALAGDAAAARDLLGRALALDPSNLAALHYLEELADR
jgi:tetratricopeptide (TPR) repeat protein